MSSNQNNYASPWLRFSSILFMLAFFLGISIFLGLAVGSSGYNFSEVFDFLGNKRNSDPMLQTIIWKIRFPRVILAAMVGASLALGGLVFQALLRNSLAEPYILGVSGGSAIGAIIAMLLGFSAFVCPWMSFGKVMVPVFSVFSQ